jgi:hypothetical protein
MLVRPGYDGRTFPENDLSYLAFVTTAYRNLHRLQQSFEPIELGLERDEPHGFLDEVPILSHLPVSIQIDLLAAVWARHYSQRFYRANLLDGAVIFAACREVIDALADDPSLVRMYLSDATRDLDVRLDRWTLNHLKTLYERWWRSFEPGRVRSSLDLERYSSRLVTPLEEARDQVEVSLNVARNLKGLVTPADIRHYIPLLTRAIDQP